MDYFVYHILSHYYIKSYTYNNTTESFFLCFNMFLALIKSVCYMRPFSHVLHVVYFFVDFSPNQFICTVEYVF